MSNYHRKRNEVQNSSQEIRDAVYMSAGWIYKQGAGLFYLLFYLICLLRYLNFVPVIINTFKKVFRRPAVNSQLKYDLTDSIVYRASFTERMMNLFKSESSKRDFLLSWVRRMLPDQNVNDFNQSWCSGITLCALAEATKPGTCPRYDLLLPGEDVNNCRLGMKLIRRSFGILEPMDPEEMASPNLLNEDVIVSYISTIRYASMAPDCSSETSQTVTYSSGTEKENGLPAIQECEASGSGLVTAIVGRRAKFNVTKPTYIKKKLTIEIEGPNGENIRRQIEDFSNDDQVKQYPEDIEGILSNSGEYSAKATGAINFDYQKIKAGYYQVSYTPPSAGLYQLSVFWGGEHITSSPFSIQVMKTKSVHTLVKKSVSFSSNAEGSTEGSISNENSPLEETAVRVRRQSLFRQAHVSSTNKESNLSSCSSSAMSTSSSQDLYRTTSLFASSCDDRLSPSISLSRSGSILSSSGDRQGTLRTRRRVIKRVVKGPDGKDEVYYPSSSDQSFQRSSDLGSLSLSLSVSYDDRLSPYPSRSPSPSPVFLAPAPTLANAERQISRFAQRSAQLILSGAFYELSKDVIFASSKLKEQERSSEVNVIKPACKEIKDRPSLTETQDTTSPSLLDGISIKTDSMVDDVFDTSLSVESSDRYEVVRPIVGSSNSSTDRYQQKFGRPRYESETYFRPISRDTVNIPLASRNPKWRSRSESDNHKSLDGEINGSENIPSGFTCFKPVSRKLGETKQVAEEDNGHVACNPSSAVHIRHPKLKSRRLKEHLHQETQCSADEIKRTTGWVSRRERFKSVHNMKEVKSRDLMLSKDQFSNTFRTSVKQEINTEEDNQPESQPQKKSKGDTTHVELSRIRAVSEPSEHEIRRPQMNPRSKSFGKQSTFDSGYSDENGHNGTHVALLTETTTNYENGSTPNKRSSPDGDTHDPPKENNSSEKRYQKKENGIPSDLMPRTIVKERKNDFGILTGKQEHNQISEIEEQSQLEFVAPKEMTSHTDDQEVENGTDDSVTNGKFFNQNSTVDNTQPFSTYWDELIYHLENDPKFPVHEFISRVKNISMDADTNDSLIPKVNQGVTNENFDTNGNRVVVNEDLNANSSRNPPSTDSESAVRPSCCRAQGCGLQNGTVGSKNNFQVCTQDAGDGSLSVSIRGPRRHAVTECSVIYTGDDFYEVLYDVSLAGFYVISVKWADLHISDSPFIVKVSF